MKGISLDFSDEKSPGISVKKAKQPEFGKIFDEWVDIYWSGDFYQKIDAVYKISELFRDCLEDPENENGVYDFEVDALKKIKEVFEDFYSPSGSVLAA